MAIRVLGLTQGKIGDPLASSGLNSSVFSALARQTQLVETLDISLQGGQRWWNALSHWHPSRDIWRERFDQNVWSFKSLSRMAGHLLAERQAKFDLVFQLRTLYSPGLPPGPWPYVIMTDNTYALSDRYYPAWAPMRSAEKKDWLALERDAYQRAVAVFARTPWLQRSLIEDYGLPPEKVVMVGTGSNFAPDQVPLHKAADDGRTILFVGKELKRKGIATLLEAFAQVYRQRPDARLVVVGRDFKTEQPGVQVLGKISNRQRLSEIFQQASIFVLPANFEPCGNVVIEAMAYHLPCIVSNAGGIGDLVTHNQTGYVIPPKDPEMLADSLLTLLSDARKRKEMGECGAQRVREELNWDSVVQKIVPYLEPFGSR